MTGYDGIEIRVEKYSAVPVEEWIRARLTNIVTRKGKYGPLHSFEFSVLEKGYEGQRVSGQVGARVSSNPNSKTYKFYSGLVGHDLEEGEVIRPKGFIGRVYEVFLEERKGENRTFQNVTRIRLTDEKVEKEEVPEKDVKVEETKVDETSINNDVEVEDDEIPF